MTGAAASTVTSRQLGSMRETFLPIR
eukprot:COSAG02_NODE_31535_length_531_cov_74.143519_1_plen_25_part_10